MITIGGKAASGKGTISEMLVQKLGYQYLSIGNLKRALAQEMRISIDKFNILGDQPGNAEKFDKQYEDMQKALNPNDPIILDSRLGFYCQPNAFNVFLDVSIQEAAKRMLQAGRGTDERQYANEQEAIAGIQERNKKDQERYIALYNIDYFDHTNYDLAIDTSDKTTEEVLLMVLDGYTNFKQNN